MLKIYGPKTLRGPDLRDLMAELFATPKNVAKILGVNERTVFRWLSDDTAPKSALLALWHETPRGRLTSALDVGNALTLERLHTNELRNAHAALCRQVVKILAICQTGSANDPIMNLPREMPPVKPMLDDDITPRLAVYFEPLGLRAEARQLELLFF
jgi:hypothetical protein